MRSLTTSSAWLIRSKSRFAYLPDVSHCSPSRLMIASTACILLQRRSTEISRTTIIAFRHSFCEARSIKFFRVLIVIIYRYLCTLINWSSRKWKTTSGSSLPHSCWSWSWSMGLLSSSLALTSRIALIRWSKLTILILILFYIHRFALLFWIIFWFIGSAQVASTLRKRRSCFVGYFLIVILIILLVHQILRSKISFRLGSLTTNMTWTWNSWI